MIQGKKTKIYNISADLVPVDIEVIKAYMLGAVNSFCNVQPGEPFSVRILFGGNNRDWHNTPMQKLYDYYLSQGKSTEEAHQSAAIDAGRLLKTVLERDQREFAMVGQETGKQYKLV